MNNNLDLDKVLEKKNIDVIIDNKSYTLSTVENEEYIKGVSKYINNKIKEILSSSKGIKKSQISFYILLCLNIADDLFKQRQHSLKNNSEIENLNLKLNKIKEKNLNLEKELNNKSKEIYELNKSLEEYKNNDEKNNKAIETKINKLTEENEILRRSFDYFSEELNKKLEVFEITDEISEIVSLHNKTILKLAKRLENMKNLEEN